MSNILLTVHFVIENQRVSSLSATVSPNLLAFVIGCYEFSNKYLSFINLLPASLSEWVNVVPCLESL